jgi:hypothetical protein
MVGAMNLFETNGAERAAKRAEDIARGTGSGGQISERENFADIMETVIGVRLDDPTASATSSETVDTRPREAFAAVLPKAKGPDKLREVCTEMESIFVKQMLSQMKKNVEKSEFLHGGYAEDIFEDMLYDEYAMMISKNSDLGIARQMYEQLSRRA